MATETSSSVIFFSLTARAVEVNLVGSAPDVAAPLKDCKFSGASPILLERHKYRLESLETLALIPKARLGIVPCVRRVREHLCTLV